MALELTDLTDDERLALVALLQLVVEADNYATDDEAKGLRAVVRGIGKKSYEAAVEDADARFEDPDELRAFLQTITRQPARDLIYELVLESALADASVQPERELLDWLAGLWQVEVRVVDSPK